MEKVDYQKLNYYLNGCFKELEINDSFLLRNLYPLGILSDKYISLVNDYELEIYNKQNNLTFNDVYLLAREILESIDESYLKYYDQMLENGQLDFSYNSEYYDSHFFYSNSSDLRLLNINRDFNYTDVSTLIHEFIHYMNGLDNKYSINRYLLTEAISIYFQEYSKLYLLNKGISKEELFFNERIIYTKMAASKFNWYSFILLSYEKFGEINENTYKLISDYFCNITKEGFEEECSKFLSFCEKEHEEYKFEYKMTTDDQNMNNFEENLFERLAKCHNVHYRYIFGTYIAYYALENSSLEKMTYLCNHINEYPYTSIDVIDALKTIDIDIEKIDISTIKNVLEKNNTKRKNL